MLKKSAAVNYSKSTEMDDIGTQTNKRCWKVFLNYSTTVHTGKDIMSFTVNLKIDYNLTGYNNQQQITVPRTV